ncbi:MAG: NADH-ubiquinone oxidoreductase-F iron-sulfur binding region domain-containing protein [Candidatus Dormibacteria bacterium]
MSEVLPAPLAWDEPLALLASGASVGSPDRVVACVGEPGSRILAGPGRSAGMESLPEHLDRLGLLPDLGDAARIRDQVEESGLQGRGGSGFPTAAKMRAVVERAARPLVVVNGSESEPASRKDRTLLALRPHLVLDGAAVAAAAVGADQIIVHVHRESSDAIAGLVRALEERRRASLLEPRADISCGPPRYVAGESSAIIHFLEDGDARPLTDRRAARAGIHGRPTLLLNAETMGHLALIARRGPGWFRLAGTSGSPGSSLVTLAGAVPAGPRVFEVGGAVTAGSLLHDRGGLSTPPRAVLLGGYAGLWVDGGGAWDLRLARDELATEGLSFGCGLIGILPWDACGLAETARLLTYLAGESAGQCGPCAFGLPRLAEAMSALAFGRAGRREVRLLLRRSATITGRGACHHPDGAVLLLHHALAVFEDDVERHIRRGPCPRAAHAPVFRIPKEEAGARWR